MKRKAAREEEDFKNRINPGGVYTAHRDSDGKRNFYRGSSRDYKHLQNTKLYTMIIQVKNSMMTMLNI